MILAGDQFFLLIVEFDSVIYDNIMFFSSKNSYSGLKNGFN
jgi:hypothetical protein